MAFSWSRSTRRETPTLGKQLVIIITCESSAPFSVIYKAGREPTPHWWISVSIVIFHVTLSKPSQFTILTWTAIRNYGKVSISCSINGSQSSMFKAIDNTFIIGNKSVITSRTFSINQQSIMVTVQFLKKRLRFSFVRNPNVWLSELSWHWRLGLLLLLKKGKRIIRKYISHSYM